MMVFLGAMLAAMLASCMSAARGAQQSYEILKRGQCAQGRVLRVWRPPIPGSFARVYFEFEPEGSGRKVRCCHVDRRPLDVQLASLPPVGSMVRISYLPENPGRAVIAKLVSRFAR